MARNLSAQEGIGTDGDFINGDLVDYQTLIGEGINQDIVQLFQKLMFRAGLTPSGDPDNEANGYQFVSAMMAVIGVVFTGNISSGGLVSSSKQVQNFTFTNSSTGYYKINELSTDDLLEYTIQVTAQALNTTPLKANIENDFGGETVGIRISDSAGANVNAAFMITIIKIN